MIDRIANQTPATITALTNETGAYVNYEAEAINVARARPVMIIVREDGPDVARQWRDAHAPTLNSWRSGSS